MKGERREQWNSVGGGGSREEGAVLQQPCGGADVDRP